MKSRLSPVKGAVVHTLMRFHPITREIDPRVKTYWVVERAAVSNRYLYIRIPKCANSTIAKTLAHYDPDIVTDGIADDPRGARTKNRYGTLVSTRVLSPAALTERYFCFTFVRNPYSRVLSAYLDKIAGSNQTTDKYNMVLRFAGTKRLADVTFAQFVEYLESGGLFENPHWAPMSALLPIRRERIHFVGRVEQLDSDLERVVNRVFGEGTFKGTQIRTVGRRNAVALQDQYYTGDLAERIYTLYRDDFESFDYPRARDRQ